MNIAARIAEYARPGEVLVTQEVVDVSDGRRWCSRRSGLSS